MPAPNYHDLFERNWDGLKANITFAANYKEKWTSLIPLFEQISAQNAVFIMIWNMIINRIIYVVDKKGVVGHDISNYLTANWYEFTSSNIHPSFVEAVALMQQEGTKHFIEESNGNPEKFIMNLDFLYKKATGEYFHFLQQSVCVC